MAHPITLAELGPGEFRASAGRLVAVYASAMRPPQRMLAGRESIMERHAANPGFRALAAFTQGRPGGPAIPGGSGHGGSRRDAVDHGAPQPGGQVLAGFIYGFHGRPGQWWHDTVAGALALSPAVPFGQPGSWGQGADPGWLDDSFEVAELHVLPAYQGMGIGRELLLRLTSGRPERTAVLSTADAESRARRLYRGVGFTDLLTGFRFSGGEPPYAVMGAKLPLLGAAPARSASPSNW